MIKIDKNIIKWSLIAFGVFIISAGVIVAIMLLVVKPSEPNKPADNNTNNDSTALVPDTSKDFGACNLVDKTLIQSSFGSTADNLQGPNNMGLVYIGGSGGSGSNAVSDQTQKCVYSFTTGGTMDNSFNASNGFSVEVYHYGSQADAVTAKDFYGKNQTIESLNMATEVVNGLGEAAFYEAKSNVSISTGPTTSGAQSNDTTYNTYLLIVFQNQAHYAFTLSQPTADSTFDYETALSALKTIAGSVDFAKL